jgi:hypothetical protein
MKKSLLVGGWTIFQDHPYALSMTNVVENRCTRIVGQKYAALWQIIVGSLPIPLSLDRFTHSRHPIEHPQGSVWMPKETTNILRG